MLIRRLIPESPRWLMTHSRVEEAETVVAHIEAGGPARSRSRKLAGPQGSIALHPRPGATVATVARELFKSYPQRTMLGISLMVTQAFMYNAVSFTYPLILTKYYAVPSSRIGLYILPFALGNFLGRSCSADSSTP